MRESTIEKKVCDYAKRMGCLADKFTSPSRRAVPDRIITTPQGVTGFLELKAPGKKPTRCQNYELQKRRALNAPADWADSVERGIAFVDRLLTLRVV